jgi:hypothetical protein
MWLFGFYWSEVLWDCVVSYCCGDMGGKGREKGCRPTTGCRLRCSGGATQSIICISSQIESSTHNARRAAILPMCSPLRSLPTPIHQTPASLPTPKTHTHTHRLTNTNQPNTPTLKNTHQHNT